MWMGSGILMKVWKWMENGFLSRFHGFSVEPNDLTNRFNLLVESDCTNTYILKQKEEDMQKVSLLIHFFIHVDPHLIKLSSKILMSKLTLPHCSMHLNTAIPAAYSVCDSIDENFISFQKLGGCGALNASIF